MRIYITCELDKTTGQITHLDPYDNIKSDINCAKEYTVTGIADGNKYTYDISKSDWESLYVNAEFGFSKFRFGKELFNVDLAR